MSPEESLRAYDLAPCGLLTLDPEFNILSANRYFRDVAGLPTGAPFEPVKFTALLSVASRVYVQSRLQPQLALAGRVDEIVLDIVRPDGGRVPIMLNAVQERDADNRPGAVHIGMGRVVAKRAYEAEVPKARQEALSALRVKADFLANISHEIRTPLNGVIGVVGALQRTSLTAQQREMTALIESSATTLERLVGDLLEISKVEATGLALHPHPFRPAEELRGVLDLARLAAQAKGVAFESDCDPSLNGLFLGDAVRLKQILNNLTANAVKFTNQGVVKADLSLEVVDGSSTLVLSVRDTGIGFAQDQADALFQPFHQADAGISRQFGGAGLGLTISKALVELMDGSIAVVSAPGEGSTFSVRIPLVEIEDQQQPRAPEPPDLDRSLRILLVEDNETNQRVIKMILTEAGVELTVASNGALGLEAWRNAAFDLVLMDMQMPVMDGLTAIRAIRAEEQRYPQRTPIPIAVLSANAMDHHRAEALAAGANLHIPKPISAAGLLIGIDETLAIAGA